MNKNRNLWLAKMIVIIFLGIMLAQLMTESPSVLSAMRAAMYYSVLYFGYRFGAGPGGIVGTACGIIETLGREDMAPLGLFCLMGVLAGTFRELGRVPAVIAWLCGGLGIGVLYAPDYLTGSVPEMFTGAALFLLTPQAFLAMTGQKSNGKGDMEQMQRTLLTEAARSYGKLARSLMNLDCEGREITVAQAEEAICRTSAMVCGGCRQCSLARENGCDEHSLEHLCCRWKEKGQLEAADLTPDFAQECRRLDMYLEVLEDCLGSMDYEEGWKSRFFESREAASLQFREMERMLEEMAGRLEQSVNVTDSFEERLRRILKRHHLRLDRLLVLEGPQARQEAYVTVSTGRDSCVTVKELSESVGRALSRNMRAAEGGRAVVGKEPCTIRLVEDTKFRLLSGVARECKEGEELSGDNFSCHSLPDGRMMLCLSDGMGSGRQAFLESQLVTELLEELLDAGFSPERAIYMLNALLLVREEEQAPATLDLVLVDLYTGQARFFKQGAVSTFIRRAGEVLEIEPGSLPMGMECEAEPVSADARLEDGDILVMVTDGVLEAMEGTDKEEAMRLFLAGTTADNARELAGQVLHAGWQEDQPARDDMTVLTAGIWRK